jgi:endonuclease/exonuclease/phosphatase family metal-dependent hydrolase
MVTPVYEKRGMLKICLVKTRFDKLEVIIIQLKADIGLEQRIGQVKFILITEAI